METIGRARNFPSLKFRDPKPEPLNPSQTPGRFQKVDPLSGLL